MEPLLWKVLLMLNDRGAFSTAPGRSGWMLDAGAHDGKSTRMLAGLAPGRSSVLAVEPLLTNYLAVDALADERPDGAIVARHGGLGAHAGTGHYPGAYDAYRAGAGPITHSFRGARHAGGREGNASYAITTIDALFAAREPLVLAHLDVEGREPDALRGGARTIARDRPTLTVETHSQHMPIERAEALRLLEHRFNYTVREVRERCGWPDCRNHVAVPRERANLVDALEEHASQFF